jgi:hypothetical protein
LLLFALAPLSYSQAAPSIHLCDAVTAGYPVAGEHFKIPDPVEFQSLSPNQVAQELEANDSSAEYVSDLRKLQLELHQKKPELENARLVVYPAAGVDAAVSLLFPKADVIAIDDHAFVPDMYRRIISALKEANPEFRLLSVGVFQKKNELDIRLQNAESYRPIHGIIHYDTGRGTPVRTYVHLNAVFPTRHSEASCSWWYPSLNVYPPDVVFIKGAMRRLSSETNPFSHEMFLRWLEGSDGWMLEEKGSEFFTPEDLVKSLASGTVVQLSSPSHQLNLHKFAKLSR